MGRVLLGAFLTAVFLATQGVHILVRGAFLPASPRLGARLAPRRRAFYAAFHFVSAIAILALLIETAIKHHVTLRLVGERLGPVYQLVLVALSIVAVGIWCIIRPSGMIGWIRHDHPDLEDTPGILLTIRFIGAGFCAFGGVLLFRLVG